MKERVEKGEDGIREYRAVRHNPDVLILLPDNDLCL
jgi:hypothetical protein